MRLPEEVLLQRLHGIVAGLNQDAIYRSVYDPWGNLLAEGLEPLKRQLLNDFGKVDFQNKTVVDLGCNFGLFSFLASAGGARRVLGLDSMPEVVEGAEILARLKKNDTIAFQVFDFEEQKSLPGSFDMVMLVDFFGKSSIRKRKVDGILEFMTSSDARELLFAIRPINRIESDLKLTTSTFATLYPQKYIHNDSFSLLDYIGDILGSQWQIEPISRYDGKYCKHKLLFLCRRI